MTQHGYRGVGIANACPECRWRDATMNSLWRRKGRSLVSVAALAAPAKKYGEYSAAMIKAEFERQLNSLQWQLVGPEVPLHPDLLGRIKRYLQK